MMRMIMVALGVGTLALSMPAPSFAQGGPGAWGSGFDERTGCRFISPAMGWGCPAPWAASGAPGYGATAYGAPAYGAPGYGPAGYGLGYGGLGWRAGYGLGYGGLGWRAGYGLGYGGVARRAARRAGY